MFSNLNPREKRLLLLMAGLFSVFGVVILLQKAGSGDAPQGSIAEYQNALSMLSQNRAQSMERMERTERIQQQLASNNLQLHSFLERLCLENGSPTPSDYNDVETAIQGGSILETETIATVRSISAETMGPLLQAIAESPELVLLKVVDIQPQRGEPGRFNLRITVSTFRANQQQQEDS